jgi:hypothetical protein
MMPEPLDIFGPTCAIFSLADISPKEHISRKFSRALPNTREQVASLASRHEQSTVRAAFFSWEQTGDGQFSLQTQLFTIYIPHSDQRMTRLPKISSSVNAVKARGIHFPHSGNLDLAST